MLQNKIEIYILQIPCNSSGYRIMLMNGLFRKSSQPIRYAVYLIWVQFYVREKALVHNFL